MKKLLTPKQVARAIGVSEASLKRWCDRGLLETHRTAGGHRRIPFESVVEFLRKTDRPLVRPEILGLPPTSGRGEAVLDRSVERLREALEAGDEERVRTIIYDLHLSKHSVDAICDRVIVPAFDDIGLRWKNGACEIYQERRACEVCLRALYHLSSAINEPPAQAPRAIGATLTGDWYSQAITMVELTLRQIGWRAESLGPGHPASSLCAAIRQERPRLFWLSVSVIDSEESFIRDYEEVYAVAADHRVAMVVGGKALTPEVRDRIQFAAYCDTLGRLVDFARVLHHPE